MVRISGESAALRISGHKARFVYLPNLRLPIEYSLGNVDCVVANKSYDLSDDSGLKTYTSMDTIVYQNYAMTLAQNNATIRSIRDLVDMRVLGFNNAAKYLGSQFAEMARDNKEYSELADQSLQVGMLYSGRVEVVVSDKRIFLWWRKKKMEKPEANDPDFTAPLDFHPIFPPAHRCVYFHDEQLRNGFNNAIQQMIETGQFDSIIRHYTSQP